jgi:hypothetical protein
MAPLRCARNPSHILGKRERAAQGSKVLGGSEREQLAALDRPLRWQDARENEVRAPADRVARFHLGNGTRLERLNWLADSSEGALNGTQVPCSWKEEWPELAHEDFRCRAQISVGIGGTLDIKLGPGGLKSGAYDPSLP